MCPESQSHQNSFVCLGSHCHAHSLNSTQLTVRVTESGTMEREVAVSTSLILKLLVWSCGHVLDTIIIKELQGLVTLGLVTQRSDAKVEWRCHDTCSALPLSFACVGSCSLVFARVRSCSLVCAPVCSCSLVFARVSVCTSPSACNLHGAQGADSMSCPNC